jgi:hypothetical protein
MSGLLSDFFEIGKLFVFFCLFRKAEKAELTMGCVFVSLLFSFQGSIVLCRRFFVVSEDYLNIFIMACQAFSQSFFFLFFESFA